MREPHDCEPRDHRLLDDIVEYSCTLGLPVDPDTLARRVATVHLDQCELDLDKMLSMPRDEFARIVGIFVDGWDAAEQRAVTLPFGIARRARTRPYVRRTE